MLYDLLAHRLTSISKLCTPIALTLLIHIKKNPSNLSNLWKAKLGN